VLGLEGPQASRRLLQLPLAADAIASAGLVPRDCEVDEPLKEVSFCRLGRTPRVLQLLVGGEELAPADQVESGGELLRLRL
jgi:hypothetical protein